MNLLQVVGPIYWIAKNNVPRTQPIIAKGFMHETASPWRKGTGIQIRVFSRSLQFGICKKQEYDETSGILSAVRGRFLDIPPREIGKMYKSSARKKHETLEQAK